MILGRIFDAEMRGLENLKKYFALYLLQVKRFRWIMNFDEKRNLKGHAKSLKIEAAGAKGMFFYDFLKLWEAPVF